MTKEEAAAALDGNEYRDEGSKELFARMKASGLVAVFGGSDDLIEFRGAIDDEAGAGSDALIDAGGSMQSECEEGEECPYFQKLATDAAKIEPLFAEEGDFTFTYKTSIPHATFVVMDDDVTYCRGIVFDLAVLS